MSDGTVSTTKRSKGGWFTLLALVALAAQVHVFCAQPAEARLERKLAQREALRERVRAEHETGLNLAARREGLLRDAETREAECRRRGHGRPGEILYLPVRSAR